MLLSAPVSFKESRNSMDDKLLDLMWGKDKVRQTMNSTVSLAQLSLCLNLYESISGWWRGNKWHVGRRLTCSLVVVWWCSV